MQLSYDNICQKKKQKKTQRFLRFNFIVCTVNLWKSNIRLLLSIIIAGAYQDRGSRGGVREGGGVSAKQAGDGGCCEACDWSVPWWEGTGGDPFH